MAFRPSPVRTACSIQYSLITGSIPGIAASTNATLELDSDPNSVDAPENNFALELIWACTSIPITSSQSCLAPEITLGFGVSYVRSSIVPPCCSIASRGLNQLTVCRKRPEPQITFVVIKNTRFKILSKKFL